MVRAAARGASDPDTMIAAKRPQATRAPRLRGCLWMKSGPQRLTRASWTAAQGGGEVHTGRKRSDRQILRLHESPLERGSPHFLGRCNGLEVHGTGGSPGSDPPQP